MPHYERSKLSQSKNVEYYVIKIAQFYLAYIYIYILYPSNQYSGVTAKNRDPTMLTAPHTMYPRMCGKIKFCTSNGQLSRILALLFTLHRTKCSAAISQFTVKSPHIFQRACICLPLPLPLSVEYYTYIARLCGALAMKLTINKPNRSILECAGNLDAGDIILKIWVICYWQKTKQRHPNIHIIISVRSVYDSLA